MTQKLNDYYAGIVMSALVEKMRTSLPQQILTKLGDLHAVHGEKIFQSTVIDSYEKVFIKEGRDIRCSDDCEYFLNMCRVVAEDFAKVPAAHELAHTYNAAKKYFHYADEHDIGLVLDDFLRMSRERGVSDAEISKSFIHIRNRIYAANNYEDWKKEVIDRTPW